MLRLINLRKSVVTLLILVSQISEENLLALKENKWLEFVDDSNRWIFTLVGGKWILLAKLLFVLFVVIKQVIVKHIIVFEFVT